MKRIDLLFRSIDNRIKKQKKNRGDSLRFKNYYLKTEDGNGGVFAKIFDCLIKGAIIFCILFLFSYLRTGRSYLSIVISSIAVSIFYIVTIKHQNFRFQQLKEKKRQYIAGRKVYSEIMNKTVSETKDYIKEIFTSVGFSRFEFMENTQNRILLKTLYGGNRIMVLFNIYKNDLEVELREVKEFVHVMEDNNTKRGIFITTSDFTKDSYDFINKLSKNYTLLPINKKQLLNIIKRSGLFPGEDEIDEMIENKISKTRNRLNEYRKTILSKNKIKGYIVLALYLTLTAWYTPYIIYYMIMAGFILALAFITFISNIDYDSGTEEDKPTDFKELLNDI